MSEQMRIVSIVGVTPNLVKAGQVILQLHTQPGRLYRSSQRLEAVITHAA
jgi:hypothetical protein